MAPTWCGDNLCRWGTWLPKPSTEAPPADGPAIRVLQFNMCGSSCNGGSNGGPVDALRDSILNQRPHIVMLNEVCLAQADRLVVLLETAGLAINGALGVTTGHSNCPGEPGQRWYGNAVFTRSAGIGNPELIELPNKPRARERRSAVAMTADLNGSQVWVSCAHLIPESYSGMNTEQMRVIASVHNRLAESGQAVVLAGDFNAKPDQIRGIAAPDGQFQEVDFAGNHRTYRAHKIDYVFMNTGRFYGFSAHTTKSSYSDHRQLWGEATLRA